jgi:threonylcarbamoyladenosine tRNA methylthiotransferase MtaB
MPQVPGNVVKERAAKLRAKGNEVLASYLEGQRGKVVEVLVERDGNGRTPQFAEVFMQGERVHGVGAIVSAHIKRTDAQRLVGEVCA